MKKIYGIKSLKNIITFILKSQLKQKNILILGDTGIGKTETVEQIAQELGMDLITINTPTLIDEEIKGLYIKTKNDTVKQVLIGKLNNINPDKDTILYLDELNRHKDLSIYNLLLRVVLNKEIADKKYNKLHIIATANIDDEGVYRLPDALYTRMITFILYPDKDDFIEFIHRKYNLDMELVNKILHGITFRFKDENQEFTTPRQLDYVFDLLIQNNFQLTEETRTVVEGLIHHQDAEILIHNIKVNFKNFETFKKLKDKIYNNEVVTIDEFKLEESTILKTILTEYLLQPMKTKEDVLKRLDYIKNLLKIEENVKHLEQIFKQNENIFTNLYDTLRNSDWEFDFYTTNEIINILEDIRQLTYL